ncbi:MAG: hypothetical protein WCS91_02100 [Bacilli bacterium]|jgi:hypothetical protein
MHFNTLLDRLKWFIGSLFFPISLALLVFLVWAFPFQWNWVFVIFYMMMSFLPLAERNGKGYLPLLLFPILSVSSDISIDGVPATMICMLSSAIFSLVLFLILHKVRFRRGDLLVTSSCLYFLFLVSYISHSVSHRHFEPTGILYLTALFLILILYALVCSALGNAESLPYFCKTVVVFSMAIVLEIFTYLCKNGFTIVGSDFSLGWSYTPQTASTLLCLSLAFYSMLVYNKKPWYILPMLFVFAGTIFLSADSGLLALIFLIIPLVLLTFRSYGRFYPYISLFSLVLVGSLFSGLLAYNRSFNTRVLTAFQSLYFSNESEEWRQELYAFAGSQISAHPFFGSSIAVLVQPNGTIQLCSDTYLSTMVLGGAFGMVAYVANEINVYTRCLQKKDPDKWLFLIFLLVTEMIGLVDNTCYNLIILGFFLLANGCYQMSNRPEDVIIHDDYYRNFHPGRPEKEEFLSLKEK